MENGNEKLKIEDIMNGKTGPPAEKKDEKWPGNGGGVSAVEGGPQKKISIEEFDPKILNQSFFRMTLLGSSYSGKSEFIKMIYPYIVSKYSYVCVFTPEFNSDFYNGFVNDIVSSKTGKLVTKTMKFYTSDFDEAIRTVELIRESNASCEETVLVILDDLISNKASKNNNFMKLFASCRHSNISLVYCVQFFTHEYSNNSMRANSNVLVTTRPSTITSKKWVMKNLIEEAVCRVLWNGDEKGIKKMSEILFSKIFAKKYDKLVVYNGVMYKCSEK